MPGRKRFGRLLGGLLVLFVAAAGLFLYWPLVKPKVPPAENDQPVDVVLVGGGIMSMTLATYLNELQPDWKMQLFEQEDQVANESSNGWNNAGTGHSAFAELNYTPELPDGSIETRRAVNIAEQFEVSRQFWAHQVKAGRLPQPSEFINPTPHMSFVWGEENIAYLKKRHAALSKLPLFYGMQYSEDFEQIRKWAPLMIEGRDPKQKVAATWMPLGTDVNFGVITRNLAAALQQQPNFSLQLKHRVTALNQNPDRTWNVTVQDLASGKERTVKTRFVFIGAGGMAIKMLQLSGIPESKNYAGFPVGGQFLAFETPEVTDHHLVKAYGKAETGSPPMSVPHLDARRLDGKRVVLFGPFALYSTKYLKHGSWFDLFSSVTHNNALAMLTTGAENLDLVQYLVKQALLNDEDRQKELQKYFPEAKRGDWKLITAGQRVQIIKKDPVKGAVLQFGTEIVTDEHRSLAALLGASPGASTSPPIMLKLLAQAFPEKMAGDWKERIRTIVPSYGRQINDSAAITNEIRGMTSQVLQLPFLTVPDDPSKVPPPAAGNAALPAPAADSAVLPPPAPARKSPTRPEAAPGRGTKNLETEMQAL